MKHPHDVKDGKVGLMVKLTFFVVHREGKGIFQDSVVGMGVLLKSSK